MFLRGVVQPWFFLDHVKVILTIQRQWLWHERTHAFNIAWLSKACCTRQELSTIYTALPKNSRGEITVESDNVYRSVFKFFQTFPQHPSSSYVAWFSTIWKSKQITCYEALWNIARNYDYAGFPSRHSIGIDLLISCFATALAWYNREDVAWEYPMDQQTIPLLRKKGQTWDVWWTYIHWSKHFWNLGDPSGKSHQQKADRKEKIRKTYFKNSSSLTTSRDSPTYAALLFKARCVWVLLVMCCTVCLFNVMVGTSKDWLQREILGMARSGAGYIDDAWWCCFEGIQTIINRSINFHLSKAV